MSLNLLHKRSLASVGLLARSFSTLSVVRQADENTVEVRPLIPQASGAPATDAISVLRRDIGDVSAASASSALAPYPSYTSIFENLKPATRTRGRENSDVDAELEAKRVVPKLNTFYAANPEHEHNMDGLTSLLAKHRGIPVDTSKSTKEERFRWVTMEEYKRFGGDTRLSPKAYKELTKVLNRLFQMDEQLMPDEVEQSLERYKKQVSTVFMTKGTKKLDEFGRAEVLGKRKTSGAKVYLTKGDGQIIINGKSLDEFTPRLTDRAKLLFPFRVTGSEGEYNVFAVVTGGGPSGQIGAVAHGIARGLVVHNPLFTQRLLKAGVLVRDRRRAERKKPGKLGARKSPTWVKR
ncbi:hypothetical protein BABINDRAFT_160278 [Babjeviella inositovora NRRL Y-12698]|uniref:Small ribosomal subunit protein uS9m n=1 Tax=Babjeviella inositovora NRRL Y-12698 TaxID=984486 RepID=A0A1E3QWQ9_9ASCO|nr:uncharacterized protein BABINDRAFT_160278 [Babjeviella inositovora NRRL Y-12698]ODQ82080.1 hypothetical protein BABINDRAFT_160278 [Babjeviella inositovora NRRL Y-12698]